MDKKTFESLHGDALTALGENRLLDLLSDIGAMLEACQEAWSIREQYEKLREEYGFMLDYVERGIEDESRSRLYDNFLERADYMLACVQHAYLTTSGNSYFSTIAHRTDLGLDPESQFYHCLTSAPYDKAEAQRMQAMLSDLNNPQEVRLIIISAITLSALCVYDWHKFIILAELMYDTDVKIRARSAIGFTLIALVHNDRLLRQPRVKEQMQHFAKDKATTDLLRVVQLQLFVSSYTKRDSRKMTEEIIPGMMSAMKDINQKNGIISLDDIEMEINPDWEKAAHNSDLQAQMRSLVEMQERGADTFYATFSNLVRHQAFWNDAANWFIPFTESHKAFSNDEQTRKTVKLLSPIFSQHSFSDTEKFSLAFMFSSMPTSNISEQMKEQLAGLDNFGNEKESLATDAEEQLRRTVRSASQDLYRFFTLFRFPLPMANPFEGELLLQKLDVFSFLKDNGELTLAFANYTFHEHDYLRAAELFKLLPPQFFDAREYEMWAATCYNLMHYDEAAKHLERALLLRPDSVWSLRLLAGAHIRTKKYDEALRTLQDWEHLAPDDLTMLQNLGECYLRLSKPERALEKFFKLHYLRPDNRSRRAIAWCCMILGKMEQADDYYKQLLSNNPSATDMLNAAHCALIQAKRKEAVELYRRCLKANGKDFAESNFFSADEKLLFDNGIKKTDLLLIRDAVNRKEE